MLSLRWQTVPTRVCRLLVWSPTGQALGTVESGSEPPSPEGLRQTSALGLGWGL